MLSPAPIDGDVPPLGPFDEAALPRSKYALLMVVDEALRKGDREILGRVTFDAATMKRRCPGRSEKMAALRAESGRAFAACAGFVDWSQAERFALDDNAHLGSPPRSCGFHKAGAKLQYSTDGKVVEIDVRAVAYPGARRYALVQPIACRVRHTYDREGKTIATSPEAVLKGSKSARRHCPHLPWPHVFGPRWSSENLQGVRQAGVPLSQALSGAPRAMDSRAPRPAPAHACATGFRGMGPDRRTR